MQEYEYEPVNNSPYLRIAEGEEVTLRLASAPIHFTEMFKDKKTGEEEENERFAWVVIVRSTGDIKAFKSGVLIYKAVKELAMNKSWGDPKRYDITIKNTGEPGSRYYIVTPLPDKSDITDGEKEAITKADLNLEKLFKTTDKGTSTFGGKEDSKKEKTKESKEGNEINLDDIPF